MPAPPVDPAGLNMKAQFRRAGTTGKRVPRPVTSTEACYRVGKAGHCGVRVAEKTAEAEGWCRTRVLTAAEQRQIFDFYPASDPFRDFLTALAETGARPGKIA